jgi:iron complex outermembrane receptor protein
MLPSVICAQSTGTVTTEEEREIVVTGTRGLTGVEGVVVPDTTKAKGLLTQELIQKQSPGQTILNAINLVPGVNFTNADAYGSSGGNIRIRGFDGNRISLTFDGMPLNDSGNYAIFSNQQLDPELIDQVNVGLGVTDVDSPTASAAGGTVNYRTIIPGNAMGARASASLGEDRYRRLFTLFQTGSLGAIGTKAWISGSVARNDKFKGPGKINKKQFNARVYHSLNDGGDFLSVAGHYNRNRNNFYRNPTVSDLRTVTADEDLLANNNLATADDPIRVGYVNGDQQDSIFGFDNDQECVNANNTFSGCSNYFNVRINPSNTGNIRGQSRFTLNDSLILTVDPSYQYVLANGGGTTTLAESSARARGATPTAPGVDFNDDGDFGDTVRFYSPNTTNTNRFGLTSSLIWDVAAEHRLRFAYTFDRARHRQTGEWSYLDDEGNPEDPFSARGDATPVETADGFELGQRDRKSIALLNQLSGQYIGRFLDNKLRVEVGVRRPFFKRELNQYCYTEARGSGFAYCTSEPASTLKIIAPDAAVPGTGPTPYFAPFESEYKFGKLLPNVGFTYRVAGPVSVFGSYAKGFSAPRTDNLYRAPLVDIDPEETNAFDLGARYTNGRVQAQGTVWKIDYSNRIVSSFNQDLGISLDRNVGKVNSWGLDGSVAFKPIPELSLLALASYIDTELQENVEIGSTTAATPPAGLIFCNGTSGTTCAPTRGKMVAETPKVQFGGRANLELGAVEFGIQGKRVGSRFATDVNDVKLKGYNLVDLDARLNLSRLGLGLSGLGQTYLQANVINLFNEFYFGNISTAIRAADNPNFSVGAPRTFSLTLNVGI